MKRKKEGMNNYVGAFLFSKKCILKQKEQLLMILPGHSVHDAMDIAASTLPNCPARQSLHFDCPS